MKMQPRRTTQKCRRCLPCLPSQMPRPVRWEYAWSSLAVARFQNPAMPKNLTIHPSTIQGHDDDQRPFKRFRRLHTSCRVRCSRLYSTNVASRIGRSRGAAKKQSVEKRCTLTWRWIWGSIRGRSGLLRCRRFRRAARLGRRCHRRRTVLPLHQLRLLQFPL